MVSHIMSHISKGSVMVLNEYLHHLFERIGMRKLTYWKHKINKKKFASRIIPASTQHPAASGHYASRKHAQQTTTKTSHDKQIKTSDIHTNPTKPCSHASHLTGRPPLACSRSITRCTCT